MTGIWVVIGSVLFFYDSLAYTGTWLFLLGSVQLLIRPTIRLTRQVHLQRLHPPPGTAHDFKPADHARPLQRTPGPRCSAKAIRRRGRAGSRSSPRRWKSH